jgi:pectin methylesterase-like acyl-CoA thioesterase
MAEMPNGQSVLHDSILGYEEYFNIAEQCWSNCLVTSRSYESDTIWSAFIIVQINLNLLYQLHSQ